jgi:hypothetical protein
LLRLNERGINVMITSTEVVLTPTESKRLLARAVLNRDEVKKALAEGMLIIHPSSTSMFMLEELGLKVHEQGIWICGHISPKGLCISRGVIDLRMRTPNWSSAMYPFELVIRKGELVPFEESALAPVLEQITPDDVYVKGVNAIDPAGKAGVLLAGRSTGGSVGLVIKKHKKVNFKIIIPVGLEKRIPIPLRQAIKAAKEAEKAQGIPCSIWQFHGTIITEIEAFMQLFGVEAIPISAGGVCGAEGCIVWVLKGEEEKVEQAYRFCEQIHGHQLPYNLVVYDCKVCPRKGCNLSGKEWPPEQG